MSYPPIPPRRSIAGLSVFVFAALLTLTAFASDAFALKEGYFENGKVSIAGRSMSCARTSTLVSSKYWMAGGSIPGVIGLNPRKLKRYSKIEQWMIFTHECGHQHIGRNERKADCWAAKTGRRQGWLNRKGLARICYRLRNDPAKDGYPSGKTRCQIMRGCYIRARG